MAYRYKPKNTCKVKGGCNNFKSFGKGGYCDLHETEDPMYKDKQAKAALKADMPKVKMLIVGTDNKLVENTAAMEFQLGQNFFSEAARQIALKPFCWNCNAPIKYGYYRAATAHILLKSIFHSVKWHPLNWLALPGSCCHNITHRMDTFAKMPVFPLAVQRFRIFEPLITEKHKLLDEFLFYANQIK